MRQWWLLGAAALFACSADGNDPFPLGPGRAGSPSQDNPGNDAGVDLPPGVTLDAAPTRLHPLSPDQYRYTVRDLLGLTDADVADIKIPVDEGGLPSLLTVSKLDDAAAELVNL